MVINTIKRLAIIIFMIIISALCAHAAEELSLCRSLSIALKDNPEIATGFFSADASCHAAKSAATLANPEIIVAPTIWGEGGSDQEFLISQPLEINGSRSTRGQIATCEAAAAKYNASVTAQSVILKVKTAYWDVVRAQLQVKFSQDNLDYLNRLYTIVQRQIETGVVPGSHRLKTEVEIFRTRQELAQSQLELCQAKSELNALLNRPKDFDFCASDELSFFTVSAYNENLIKAALNCRPELKAAQAELRAAMLEIRAANLRRIPDLALQYRQENFNSKGGVAVAVSLPIIDYGSVREDIARARCNTKSKEKQLQAAINQVELDVVQSIEQLRTWEKVIKESESGLVERAQQLADMAEKGYERGVLTYMEVLEAQRTLRSAKITYLQALANYAKAASKLDWAIGSGLSCKSCAEVKK